MAWIDTKIDPAGCTVSVDDKGHRTHNFAWFVIYGDKETDFAPHAIYANGIPTRKSQHPFDSHALCTGLSVGFHDYSGNSGVVYRVSATYTTNTEPYSNPLDEPPIVKWGGENTLKIVEQDINGVAILNKAGDKFEDPVEIPDVIETFSYTQNLPYNPRELAKQFRNAINDGAWLGFAARTVRCVAIDISERKTAMINENTPGERKLYYWTVTAEFAINENEWKKSILEQGYREKIAGNLVDIFSLDEDGNKTEDRITFPCLLDNDGRAQQQDPKVPVHTDWFVFTEEDYDDLGIETLEGF